MEVAVALRSGLAYTTEILHGIAEYSRWQGHWMLEVDSSFHYGQRPARLDQDWRGDGVILLGGESQVFDSGYFRRHRIRVVNATGWRDKYPQAPQVFWDDAGIAAVAAEHLLGLGLEHFAYFGPRVFEPSHDRAVAFQRLVEGAGFSCDLCEWTRREIAEVAIWSEEAWGKAAELFRKRLSALRTPVGILANNDITASLLIAAGVGMGLRCPEDLAVVGFWNDRVICESTFPPLTSVETDFREVGYQAAGILDSMIRRPGFEPPPITRVRTKGIVVRESSDYVCFEDDLIARALRFIRKTAVFRPLTVGEVVRQVPMSRSSFGARFRRAVGLSAKKEITRVRLEHVKRLLRETDWSVSKISEMSGFESSRELDRLFHREAGATPSRYREAAKAHPKLGRATPDTLAGQGVRRAR